MDVSELSVKEFEKILDMYIEIKQAGKTLADLEKELREIEDISNSPGVVFSFANEELLFEFMVKVLFNYREVAENPVGFRNVEEISSFVERLEKEVNYPLLK